MKVGKKIKLKEVDKKKNKKNMTLLFTYIFPAFKIQKYYLYHRSLALDVLSYYRCRCYINGNCGTSQ